MFDRIIKKKKRDCVHSFSCHFLISVGFLFVFCKLNLILTLMCRGSGTMWVGPLFDSSIHFLLIAIFGHTAQDLFRESFRVTPGKIKPTVQRKLEGGLPKWASLHIRICSKVQLLFLSNLTNTADYTSCWDMLFSAVNSLWITFLVHEWYFLPVKL